MGNSFLVVIGCGAWLDARTVIVPDLTALVNLIRLTEKDDEYQVMRIDTLSSNQDYNDLIEEIIKNSSPDDMNFG